MDTVAQPQKRVIVSISRFKTKPMDLLLAAYVILLPVQLEVAAHLRIAPSDFFLLLMLAGFVLGIAPFVQPRLAWSPWHLALIITFFYASVVALVRTGYVSRVALLNKDIGLLLLFATYAVIVSHIDSWQRLRWLLRLLILTVTVHTLIALAAFVLARRAGILLPMLNQGDARVAGMLVDPNAFGGLLVLTLSLHMMTFFDRRPLVSGVLGVLVAVSLTSGLFLTYSRSAWIGLVALIGIGVIYRRKAAAMMIGLILLAMVSVVAIFGVGYMPTMTLLVTRQSQIESRVSLISEAIPMYWESPITGIGMGVYAERMFMIIHNTPVWILTECGVFGFVVLVGFMSWFILRGIQAYRIARPGCRSLVLALIAANLSMMGLSMGIEAMYQRHWWVILALTATVYNLARADKNRLARLLAERKG